MSYSFASSPRSTYWASNRVPGPVFGPRNTGTPKIQPLFSQRSQALWGLADQCHPFPHSILLDGGDGALTSSAFQTTSWRHFSSEEWLLISSKGILLKGRHFKFVLAEYWPVYIVFLQQQFLLQK